MRDWKKSSYAILWTMTACLCASPLGAQQDSGEKPKPAAREYSLPLETVENQPDADQLPPSVQPDNRPLGGVQNPSIGIPETRHSYWVPGIQYSNAARSSSFSPSVGSGWTSTSFISGDVSLLEAWSESTLTASFSSGGYVSTDSVQGNGQYQQLSAAYEFNGRRWRVLVTDEFSHLPESGFGFGGASGLSTPGVSGSLAVPALGLQNTYLPNQTVLTAVGPRYSNSSIVQLTYSLSPRGSITVAGVYGMLHFVNSGNVDSNSEMFDVGYNYLVSKKDTIGVSYRFGAYHYPGTPQALGDHVAQFTYGRKITGRLALALAGGPEIATLRVAIGSQSRTINGSGNASLSYKFSQSSVSLSYSHGLSGGSGVFKGANTDQIDTTWSRQLTRIWASTVNFGYAKNRQVVTAGGSPTYDTWLAGVGLSRQLGPTTHFALGYQALIQGVASGGTNPTSHQLFLSFQWHATPFVLR